MSKSSDSTHVTTSRKVRPSPELPPEIWGRIISYLKRPMGSTGTIRNPNDFHQRDLARAMRVNKTFYRYAAPVLYERIILSDFLLLFDGIAEITPDSKHEEIGSPKLELFKHVKRLDIAYTSASTSNIIGPSLPPDILEQLNVPSPVLPAMTNDINLTFTATLKWLIGWAKSPDAPKLFPNLQNITVGSFGERHWDRYNSNFTKLDWVDMSNFQMTPELKEAAAALHHLFKQKLFGRYLATCSNVKYVCDHISSGPMSLVWNDHFPNDPMLQTRPTSGLPDVFVTHLLDQIHVGVWIFLAEGTTNKWIINPIFQSCSPAAQATVYTFIQTQIMTRRALSSMLSMDKTTKIEIYQARNPDMMYNAMCQISGATRDRNAYSDQDLWDIMKSWLGIQGPEEDFADFQLMEEDAGACPACGLEDGEV
ncbi:uncharacterized protein IL334_003908 [Kwoniella shivajii]|uniref:F-box domain-containing protein n=1 Tax=Kwoniella shivajii TaxID=564305 RepID=A0ABZ1CZG4_9TREE|nr:hypothetical protein IL334_003908 [Kwoniella shivajii]